jgi:hypothetical protein
MREPVPLISRSFANPVVTPVTMFAISVRVRPWSARFCCESSGRCTAILPSSRSIFMLSWNVRVSWPFGPFTFTVCPSIFTSTPLGTTTGSRPILLIYVYQTYARTSPPRPLRSASRPVMSPDEVETMATPRPPRTRGISSFRA